MYFMSEIYFVVVVVVVVVGEQCNCLIKTFATNEVEIIISTFYANAFVCANKFVY